MRNGLGTIAVALLAIVCCAGLPLLLAAGLSAGIGFALGGAVIGGALLVGALGLLAVRVRRARARSSRALPDVGAASVRRER